MINFNRNNDIEYIRSNEEYIREVNVDNNQRKKKITINRNTIKKIIASIALVPTTLAVCIVQNANEKESNFGLNDISIVDDTLNKEPEVDMSKCFLAPDGSYWVSEVDYILVNGNQKSLK